MDFILLELAKSYITPYNLLKVVKKSRLSRL